jgi:transcriptional regulator with XRE-family HTH domain
MTGHRKWSEARESRRGRESDVSRSSSRADLQKKLRDHAKSLGELRSARQLTQQQLAKVMQVSQAQVSRVENQADLYLSTLRSYIQAMGGEMQIRVAFPGANWTEVTIGDVTDVEPQGTEVEAGSSSASDFFVVFSYTSTEEQNDTPGIIRIWPNTEHEAGASSVLNVALSRLWVSRTHLHASSSACGFIVRDPNLDQPALKQQFSWRTAVDPLIPTDSESFVSSAQFKEK